MGDDQGESPEAQPSTSMVKISHAKKTPKASFESALLKLKIEECINLKHAPGHVPDLFVKVKILFGFFQIGHRLTKGSGIWPKAFSAFMSAFSFAEFNIIPWSVR